MAMSLPSCENEMVRTGHSRYEKVLTQANSLTSHNETSASALPTAKYLPVGSNSIQMQFAGCACSTKSRKIVVLIKILYATNYGMTDQCPKIDLNEKSGHEPKN